MSDKIKSRALSRDDILVYCLMNVLRIGRLSDRLLNHLTKLAILAVFVVLSLVYLAQKSTKLVIVKVLDQKREISLTQGHYLLLSIGELDYLLVLEGVFPVDVNELPLSIGSDTWIDVRRGNYMNLCKFTSTPNLPDHSDDAMDS